MSRIHHQIIRYARVLIILCIIYTVTATSTPTSTPISISTSTSNDTSTTTTTPSSPSVSGDTVISLTDSSSLPPSSLSLGGDADGDGDTDIPISVLRTNTNTHINTNTNTDTLHPSRHHFAILQDQETPTDPSSEVPTEAPVIITDSEPAPTEPAPTDPPSEGVGGVEEPTQPPTDSAPTEPSVGGSDNTDTGTPTEPSVGGTDNTHEEQPVVGGVDPGIDPMTGGPTDAPTAAPINLPPPVVSTSAASLSQVFNKANLTRIKGVGYQPTPVGASPVWTPHSDEDDLYGLPYSSFHARDLPLIKSMGANVIRLWSWHEAVDHTNFLDMAHQHGLYVIITFKPDYGFPENTWDVTDERPAQWDLIKDRFRDQLRKYQYHPATLMWFIGNEPSTKTGLSSYFRLTSELANVRNEMCPSRNMSCWHPISIPFADLGTQKDDIYELSAPEPVDRLSLLFTPLEQAYPHAVDVWSFQLYRGITFGTFFSEYSWFQRKAGHSKPMIMSEFGMDALDFRIGSGAVNQTMQSMALVSQWREIASQDPKLVAGGIVFEYSDEWWKGSQFSKPVMEGCPVKDLNAHAPCGRPALGNPDKFYSEAWFGMVAYPNDDSRNLYMSPSSCIFPRDSYYAMTALWTGHNMTASERAGLCSNQACCAIKESSSLMVFGAIIGIFIAFSIGFQWYGRRQLKKAQQARMAAAAVAASMPVSVKGADGQVVTYSVPVTPATVSGVRVLPDDVPSMTDQMAIESYVHELLTPAFHRAHHLFYRYVTAHPSGYQAHVVLQQRNLTRLILQQLYRCDGNLQRAIERVHLRSFEAYVAWCKHVGTSPRFQDPLEDLAQAYVLWSTAEQLRRVASYQASRFHERGEAEVQHNNDGWKPAYEWNNIYQTKVAAYQLDYDDVEDATRQSRSVTGFFRRWWDNIRVVRAYPGLGGWFAILLDMYWILQLHVLLAILIIDAVRSPVVIANTGGYIGLVDIYLHVTSKYGMDTLIKLCIADAAMLGGLGLIDALVTLAPRIRHAALIGICALALPLLGASLPGGIQGAPKLMAMTSDTFALLYFAARVVYVIVSTLYSMITMHTNTLLPSADRSFRIPALAQTSQARSDTVAGLASKLMHKATGFFAKEPAAVAAEDPYGRAGGSGAASARGRARRACGWMLWYAARSAGFWAVVMVIKIMFDMYVLWPSVVGVTLDTLCYASPSVSSIEMGTATFMRQQQTVFFNNTNSPLSTVKSITNNPSADAVCQIFVVFLWAVTFVMSLATSYVSYTMCIGIFGLIVPQIIGSSSSRWQIRWAGIFLVLWWIVLIVALAVGAFYAALSTGLLLLIIDRVLAVNDTSNYGACRAIVTKPAAQSASSIANTAGVSGNNGSGAGLGGRLPIASPTSIQVVGDAEEQKQLTDFFANLNRRASVSYATVNFAGANGHMNGHSSNGSMNGLANKESAPLQVGANASVPAVPLTGIAARRAQAHRKNDSMDGGAAGGHEQPMGLTPNVSSSDLLKPYDGLPRRPLAHVTSDSNLSHLPASASYSSLQQLATRSLQSHYRTLAHSSAPNSVQLQTRRLSTSALPAGDSMSNSAFSTQLLALFASDHVIPISAVRMTRDPVRHTTTTTPISTSNVHQISQIQWIDSSRSFGNATNGNPGASSLLLHLIDRVTAGTKSLQPAITALQEHSYLVTPTGHKLSTSSSSSLDRFLATVVDQLRLENTLTQKLTGPSPIQVDALKKHIHTWIKTHMQTRIEFSGAKIDIAHLSCQHVEEHISKHSSKRNSAVDLDKEKEKDVRLPVSSDFNERILMLYMIAVSQLLHRDVVIISSASRLDAGASMSPKSVAAEKPELKSLDTAAANDDHSIIQITIRATSSTSDAVIGDSAFLQHINGEVSPLSSGPFYLYHQRLRASYRSISLFHPVCVINTLTTQLGNTFQCMFRRQLNAATTRLIWKSIIESMWRADVLGTSEIKASFSLDNPDAWMIHTPMVGETRRRFTWFFHSLLQLSQKAGTKLPSLLAMRSVTVLIPMYDETVYYTAAELCAPQIKYVPAEAAAQRQHRIAVIEFLAEKHPHEWNNLAERIAYPGRVATSVGLQDSQTEQSRALLNDFIAQHSAGTKPPAPANWNYYSECVVNWASERGQTLARTIRGMMRIRSALILTGMIELNGDIDAVRQLIDTKFQVLVSAQVYAERSRTAYRDAIRKLMRTYPWISIVYNYDLIKDVKEQARLKVLWHKSCGGVSTVDGVSELQKGITLVNDVLGPALVARKSHSSSSSSIPTPAVAAKGAGPIDPSLSLIPAVPASAPHAQALRETINTTLKSLLDNLSSFSQQITSFTQQLHAGNDVMDGDEKKVTRAASVPSDADVELSSVSDVCWRGALDCICKQLISLSQLVSPLDTGDADRGSVDLLISHIQRLVTAHERCDEYEMEMSTVRAMRIASQKLHDAYQEYLERCTQQQTTITHPSKGTQDISLLSSVSSKLQLLDDVDMLITRMHHQNQHHHHQYHAHMKALMTRINKLAVFEDASVAPSISASLSMLISPPSSPMSSSNKGRPASATASPASSHTSMSSDSNSRPSSPRGGSPAQHVIPLLGIDMDELSDLMHEWRTCLDAYLDHHYEDQRLLLIYHTIRRLQQSRSNSIEHQHKLLGWLLTHVTIPQQYGESLQDATFYLAQQRQRSQAASWHAVDQQLHTATQTLLSWLNQQLPMNKPGMNGKLPQKGKELIDEPDTTTIEMSVILENVTTALSDLLERATIATYASDEGPRPNVIAPIDEYKKPGADFDMARHKLISSYGPSQLQPQLDAIMQLITTTHTTQMEYRRIFIHRLTRATQATHRASPKLAAPMPANADGTPAGPVSAAQLYSSLTKVAIFPYASVNCRDGSAKSVTSAPLDDVILVIDRIRDLMLGSMPSTSTLSGAPQTNPKSENQLHALIFSTGEIIQAIDMNQDLSYEEALKYRWFTQEFQFNKHTDIPRYNLIGCPEVIFTENVGAVGRYMALQDLSFATIVQRVLAYTGARMHYGHPDLFDAYWIRFHVGLSKASTEKNLSEDVYFGYDSISRGAQNSFAEYIRFGKGREVGISTTVVFEDKLARGSAHTLKSPDVYRLARFMDCLSFLSLIFGSLGHYLYTLLFDYTITSFLWVLLFMAMSNVSSEQIGLLGSVYAIPWLFHLGFMFGLPLLLQLIHERGALDGFIKWARNVLLGSVYYLFQLRTKAVGVQTGFHGGSGKYKGTGRSFELGSDSLLHLYQNYARSHYHHALELMVLLFCYVAFFSTEPFFYTTLVKTYAVLLAALSWICAPALFNPSFNYETDRSTIIREHMAQLKQVKRWLDAPYLPAAGSGNTATPGESWERWYWSDRHELLRLRACRYYMQTGLRQKFNHPITFSSVEFLLRCVEWAPWIVLSYALIVNSGDVLYSVVGYLALVLVVHALTPRLLHTMVLILLILGGYAILHIQHLLVAPNSQAVTDQWILSFSNLGQVIACLVAFLILSVMITDLLIYINDGVVCYRILKNSDKEFAAKKKKNDDERAAKSGTPVPHSLDERPRLIRAISSSPLFWAWSLVYRFLCPYCIALIHLGIIILNNLWSAAHTSFFYDCSLRNLRLAHQARVLKMNGENGDANGNGITPTTTPPTARAH